MQIAIVGDQHIGIRNDNDGIQNYFEKIYTNFFFPELEKRNINIVINLGDLFDRRKYINFNTLDRAKGYYFDILKKKNIFMHLILGNHDVSFKNTNLINSPNLLLKEYSNIKIYEKVTDVEIADIKFLFVPWITVDNFEDSFKTINNSKAFILLGHLEIAGFEMYKNSVINNGFDRKLFNSFETVMSGHFHHKSKQDNIIYNGAFAEYTWSDYDDDRGFHIFDTETREFEYVKNPIKLFYKILWDDTNKQNIIKLKEDDLVKYQGTYIKVIIKNKTNPYAFDLFIKKLENAGVLDLQIIEEQLSMDIENSEDLINEAESTIDILNVYVDHLELKQDKSILKKVLFDLYHEALSL